VTENRHRGRIILAAGGYRSGSTIQYNLVGEYVERVNLGRRIGLVEPPLAAVLRGSWSLVEAIGIAVAKCHHAVAGYRDWSGHETTWPELCAEGRAIAIYTVRDWRDVAASMSRKFGLPLPDLFSSLLWRENLANMEQWLENGAFVQRYEDLVSDPERALKALCGYLDLSLNLQSLEESAREAGLERQLGIAHGLPQDRWDTRTLVHWDHFAEPDGGGWRRWSQDDLSLARAELEPLIDRFGYSWAA
jgi:hypothetical protein